MEPKSPAHVALGQAIRAARMARGWSQEDLGDAAGFHRNSIGVIERGELNVSFGNLLRIARALEVPAARLVGEAEQGVT